MLDALVRILVSLTRSSQVEPVRELRTDFFFCVCRSRSRMSSTPLLLSDDHAERVSVALVP